MEEDQVMKLESIAAKLNHLRADGNIKAGRRVMMYLDYERDMSEESIKKTVEIWRDWEKADKEVKEAINKNKDKCLVGV